MFLILHKYKDRWKLKSCVSIASTFDERSCAKTRCCGEDNMLEELKQKMSEGMEGAKEQVWRNILNLVKINNFTIITIVSKKLPNQDKRYESPS